LPHDLRSDQAELGRARDQLETERRTLAAQRQLITILPVGIMRAGNRWPGLGRRTVCLG
jgi:hypothetical protein